MIYISHPYSGLEENKTKTEEIIKTLLSIEPNQCYISPIHAFGFMYEHLSYKDGMAQCLALLLHCEMVVMCGDWKNSTGCMLEHGFAKEHKIKIVDLDEVMKNETK
jgi:hypothetical protein